MKIPANIILSIALLGCACSARAGSFKYTFTFDATSHSSLTSYSLTTNTLLSGSVSFVESQLQLTTPPATGAQFLAPFPAAIVDSTGSVSGLFYKGSGSSRVEWEFSGSTVPLTGLGTHALLPNSTSFFSGDNVSLPVRGSVVISAIPTASAPEPGSFVLLGAGALVVGSLARGRVRLPRRA